MYNMKVMRQKKDNRREGFTLVGVIASAFFAIIVLTALASMISQVYAVSRVSKNKFIAVNLAKEGIELVRNMRDTNWLHYPETHPGPETAIAWRGDNNNTDLFDICNRNGADFHTVDATVVPPRLVESSVAGQEKLYLDTNNMYTHTDTGNLSIFSRKITISTHSEPGYGTPENDCGEVIVSDALLVSKPQGFTVTSTVTWEEPGTGVVKTVSLSQDLYDWLKKRP